MKRLLLLVFIALPTFAQPPLNMLNGGNNLLEWWDGYNFRNYYMINPTGLDEGPAGFDKVWNFTSIEIPELATHYYNRDATTNESADYPGVEMVTTGMNIASTAVTSTVYSSEEGRYTLANITPAISLVYSDTPEVGAFPKAYGDLTVDTTAGSYVYGAYSGTFSGTMIAEYDAYGTMTNNFPMYDAVVVGRLKTVETLQVTYPGFGNVGTYVQTTYRYYRDGDNWPLFKSTRTQINIALLGINQDNTVYEAAEGAFLSAPAFDTEPTVLVSPNPMTTRLDITSPTPVRSATFFDVAGKQVLQSIGITSVDTSSLPSGLYFVTIETAKATVVKKVVK
ncbi:MAG TPA: T9SS type A sorting domain-containing protein [Flavobacterium sp.]|nr:T9SS type A sorting domain-containing protein [Flavobacterium sp.]